MAESILHVTVELADVPGKVAALHLDDASRPQSGVNKLASLLASVAAKLVQGAVTVHLESATNRTHATATVTCTGVPTAGDTVTVGSTVLTWAAAAADEDEVTIGADADESASALADAINAHSDLQGVVTAEATAGAVDVTAVVPGAVGNHIPLAESGTNTTVSGAFLTGWSGAEESAERQYICGLSG